jgi:hypothetical protein
MISLVAYLGIQLNVSSTIFFMNAAHGNLSMSQDESKAYADESRQFFEKSFLEFSRREWWKENKFERACAARLLYQDEMPSYDSKSKLVFNRSGVGEMIKARVKVPEVSGWRLLDIRWDADIDARHFNNIPFSHLDGVVKPDKTVELWSSSAAEFMVTCKLILRKRLADGKFVYQQVPVAATCMFFGGIVAPIPTDRELTVSFEDESKTIRMDDRPGQVKQYDIYKRNFQDVTHPTRLFNFDSSKRDSLARNRLDFAQSEGSNQSTCTINFKKISGGVAWTQASSSGIRNDLPIFEFSGSGEITFNATFSMSYQPKNMNQVVVGKDVNSGPDALYNKLGKDHPFYRVKVDIFKNMNEIEKVFQP